MEWKQQFSKHADILRHMLHRCKWKVTKYSFKFNLGNICFTTHKHFKFNFKFIILWTLVKVRFYIMCVFFFYLFYFISLYYSGNSYDEVRVMLWYYLYFITFYYSGNSYDGVRVTDVSPFSAIFRFIVTTTLIWRGNPGQLYRTDSWRKTIWRVSEWLLLNAK